MQNVSQSNELDLFSSNINAFSFVHIDIIDPDFQFKSTTGNFTERIEYH